MLCKVPSLRALRALPFILIFCGISSGCFSASKRKQMAPPTPLDTFTPLPDPRKPANTSKDPSWNNGNAPVKPVPAPNSLPPIPPLQPKVEEAPKLMAPVTEPKPTDTPKLPPIPQTLKDESEVPAIARGSSQELPKTADRESNDIDSLLKASVARLKTIDSIEARLTMRDIKEGKAQPVELVRFQHRVPHYAVHMSWVGEQFQGREVLYVAGKYDGKLQMLTAKGDIPFMPPQLMAFAPDDTMLKARSKHDIREAGPAHTLRHLQGLLNHKTFAGRLVDRGPAERSDIKGTLRLIEETVPAGDRELPRGGKRQYYFDIAENSPSKDLPVAIIATETGGRNAESMIFDQFRCNHLKDADFDVKRMGK